MRKLLGSPEEFDTIFATIKTSSWRWECQGDYGVDHEMIQRWREGVIEYRETDTWADYIHGLHEAGIPFERVRVLTNPLNEYLTWMLATTHRNVDAGEDIRWLKPSVAEELGMPDYDFYLLDDNRIVILHIGEDKVLTGAEIIDDEDVVAGHRALRDKVWPHAVRHRDYLYEIIQTGANLQLGE